MTALLVFQLGLIGIVFSGLIGGILEDQIGKRALRVSQTVSMIPEIRRELAAGDPAGVIQPLADGIRKTVGAEFVVVGDSNGIRYSHPNPDRLGKSMVGGDNAPALEDGRSYVSKAVGTLGPSLRGKTPVFDDSGAIIGIVSVGYLIENVQHIIREHRRRGFFYIGIMLIVGIGGAVLIAKRFKKAIFGLEPEEIAKLFMERSAIIESIREGIVAIDGHGAITMANEASRKNIGLPAEKEMVGQEIGEILPGLNMTEVLSEGEPALDMELNVSGRDMIFNIVPISHGDDITGAVATFRRKDEIDQLARELSHVREYSELLRAQTHEYSNKLHVLAGLIQIGAQNEALDLVAQETSGYQNVIRFLAEAVPDPLLSAIILGKYNQAQELRIRFTLDEESTLIDIPQAISRDKLVTVLGNLLDNAFDAVRRKGDVDGEVRLSMTDLGEDIIIEVEDSGDGVEEGLSERIFEKGVSSKDRPGSGMGLFLVNRTLESMQGHITMGAGDLGGALFTVAIPKERRD